MSGGGVEEGLRECWELLGIDGKRFFVESRFMILLIARLNWYLITSIEALVGVVMKFGSSMGIASSANLGWNRSGSERAWIISFRSLCAHFPLS